MLGIEHYFIFIATGIILNIYPGPDSLYIIGRSLSQGKSAGIFAALGISTGSIFHTFIGAIGLSSILLTSANAFTFIKYAGATYLIYQAILMLKESFNNSGIIKNNEQQKKSLFRIYRQGVITNILNPKVALFFMALIPQFISPNTPNKFLAFITLGLTFIFTGTIWGVLIALCSAFFSKNIRNNNTISRWLLRINACLFSCLAIKLATSQLTSQNN